MGRLAIKVEQLSKAYQLGQIGTGTISRDIERWWTTKVLRKDDPFLQIGQTNDRTTKGDSDVVWSLRDLNFEVEQGEVLGVIGRNGAGKSTLLKLLSRVTAPTDGKIKIKGRIASLLEVGTGFHPELTGRENIFLNGAILGMRKQEIAAKFDEIVAFSGVERYIDTPVKRYSSGMYVRLAFAVAAHLESEILIVDEVLAVGDAEFQKKCLGKMGEVSKGEGRTVLFVSHNMDSILSFCDSSLLLENGHLKMHANSNTVISHYLTSTCINKNKGNLSIHTERGLINVTIDKPIMIRGEDLHLAIEFDDYGFLPGEELAMILMDEWGRKLGFYTIEIKSKKSILELTMRTDFLLEASYTLTFFGHLRNQLKTFEKDENINFSIISGSEEEKLDNEIKRVNGCIFLPVSSF